MGLGGVAETTAESHHQHTREGGKVDALLQSLATIRGDRNVGSYVWTTVDMCCWWGAESTGKGDHSIRLDESKLRVQESRTRQGALPKGGLPIQRGGGEGILEETDRSLA